MNTPKYRITESDGKFRIEEKFMLFWLIPIWFYARKYIDHYTTQVITLGSLKDCEDLIAHWNHLEQKRIEGWKVVKEI